MTCVWSYRAVSIDGCGIQYRIFYSSPHPYEVHLIAEAKEELLSVVETISRALEPNSIESLYRILTRVSIIVLENAELT